MRVIGYSIEKLTGLLGEIEKLKASDFPHKEPQSALERMEACVLGTLDIFKSLDPSSNKKTIMNAAKEANTILRYYLIVNGVLIRSTHVRNQFEMYGPLSKLLSQLLDGGAKNGKLILSSEWEFSPFTYPMSFPKLKDYAIIGLPASECGNALITPLAGHEMGHLVWQKQRYENSVGQNVDKRNYENMLENPQGYQKIYKETPSDSDNMVTISRVKRAYTFAIRHLEEIFCDLIGLYVFREAYVFAFEYLLGGYSGRRSVSYPPFYKRAEYLRKAAAIWGINTPEDYEQSFDGELKPTLSPEDEYWLEVADKTVEATLAEMVNLVSSHCSSTKIIDPGSETNKKNVSAILTRFEKGVPSTGEVSFIDVINAGWVAYFDQNIWSHASYQSMRGRKRHVLNELILKSVEVIEYTQIVEDNNGQHEMSLWGGSAS